MVDAVCWCTVEVSGSLLGCLWGVIDGVADDSDLTVADDVDDL